ncbi:MAG: hypothetical protein ACD_73C00718G0003 [uncultured bacterium]|nr:MAG: hypothetical protein ACD_73C00718G0003 [uncultured bacterium]
MTQNRPPLLLSDASPSLIEFNDFYNLDGLDSSIPDGKISQEEAGLALHLFFDTPVDSYENVKEELNDFLHPPQVVIKNNLCTGLNKDNFLQYVQQLTKNNGSLFEWGALACHNALCDAEFEINERLRCFNSGERVYDSHPGFILGTTRKEIKYPLGNNNIDIIFFDQNTRAPSGQFAQNSRMKTIAIFDAAIKQEYQFKKPSLYASQIGPQVSPINWASSLFTNDNPSAADLAAMSLCVADHELNHYRFIDRMGLSYEILFRLEHNTSPNKPLNDLEEIHTKLITMVRGLAGQIQDVTPAQALAWFIIEASPMAETNGGFKSAGNYVAAMVIYSGFENGKPNFQKIKENAQKAADQILAEVLAIEKTSKIEDWLAVWQKEKKDPAIYQQTLQEYKTEIRKQGLPIDKMELPDFWVAYKHFAAWMFADSQRNAAITAALRFYNLRKQIEKILSEL